MRFDFHRKRKAILGVVLASALFAVQPVNVLFAQAICLSSGPQLFIDDYLIGESIGIDRVTHKPTKLPDPILPKLTPWNEQPLPYQKLFHDPETGQFSMWYNVKNPDYVSPAYAYATSDDGINWVRPNLGIYWGTNLLQAPTAFGSLLADEGPGCADPSKRFKLGYYVDGAGLCIAYSADGFHFTPGAGNPVIPAFDGDESLCSDILDCCWDPIQNRYLVATKQWGTGFPGTVPEAPQGWRRVVGITSTEDFVNWERPTRIVDPDLSNGMEQFYGMHPIVRGDLYIGFLRVLREDLPADPNGEVQGIGWTELVTSRDGINWTRYQDMFLDRNHTANTWDHAMAWIGDCITVDDKEYISYGGYSKGHKDGDRQGGMSFLRKDGFVSRRSGLLGGLLRTNLVRFCNTEITINADINGWMRVRLLDESGNPLPGFDFGDCSVISGDSIEHQVIWTGHLLDVCNKPVQIEFAFDGADLYAFYLTNQVLPGDANNDGKVDEIDATILAANWLNGQGATWRQGDFSGDGNVDDSDATILACNWLATKDDEILAPENSALMLLSIGCFVICSANRKRML